MKRQLIGSRRVAAWIGMAGIMVIAAGCAGARTPGTWEGPSSPQVVTTGEWSMDQLVGRRISTPNYIIYTTIDDEVLLGQIAQAMEGALTQYRKLAPDVPPTDRPMECYLFLYRAEWAEFTRKHTGADAAVYLQIMRGGYTVRDRYVAYYIGDGTTISVAVHEGWHQFVGRHFKGRLPPFLEEGISCLFEKVMWENGLPRWNLAVNSNRAMALRRAIDGDGLIPLGELVTMHAGEIVHQSSRNIEAFYAQNWAFAKFLWDADNARYRPALQKLLSDTAAGVVRDPSRSHARAGSPWRPQAVKPLLETYLDMPFAEIERAYHAYLQTIAYDDFKGQWGT